MNKLIIALIAGTFAATASAQMSPKETQDCSDFLRGKVTKLSKKERAKCADMITAATAGNASSSGQAEAMGSAEAKAMKGTPNVLPKSEKAKAVDAATASGALPSSSGQTAAMGAAAAKSEKSQPKSLPTKADKRQAVDTATKTEASK